MTEHPLSLDANSRRVFIRMAEGGRVPLVQPANLRDGQALVRRGTVHLLREPAQQMVAERRNGGDRAGPIGAIESKGEASDLCTFIERAHESQAHGGCANNRTVLSTVRRAAWSAEGEKRGRLMSWSVAVTAGRAECGRTNLKEPQ
jgi:hypothetical protein